MFYRQSTWFSTSSILQLGLLMVKGIHSELFTHLAPLFKKCLALKAALKPVGLAQSWKQVHPRESTTLNLDCPHSTLHQWLQIQTLAELTNCLQGKTVTIGLEIWGIPFLQLWQAPHPLVGTEATAPPSMPWHCLCKLPDSGHSTKVLWASILPLIKQILILTF